MLASPSLQLQTLYVLDEHGRIRSTREPHGGLGPLFALIRGRTQCVWATRVDVDSDIERQLTALAASEPPLADLRTAPLHGERYRQLLRDHLARTGKALLSYHGVAFAFPAASSALHRIATSIVDDETELHAQFKGWVDGEIALGRSPVIAVLRQGRPVSIAFCARRSEVAAEAGVETAPAFRGNGFATQVVAEWAQRMQALGVVPLYSASWNNAASLAVARKLELVAYANDWNIGATSLDAEHLEPSELGHLVGSEGDMR